MTELLLPWTLCIKDRTYNLGIFEIDQDQDHNWTIRTIGHRLHSFALPFPFKGASQAIYLKLHISTSYL